MTISSFDDLLRAAREQPEPQRLLFVFVGAELPDDSSSQQRDHFQAGQGGTLTPLMCVDKTPSELEGFETLLEESRQFGTDWVIVFAAALAGHAGRAPTSADAEAPLQKMVEAIKAGFHRSYIPFDRHGEPVLFANLE